MVSEMGAEITFAETFIEKLKHHVKRKAELYDGVAVVGRGGKGNNAHPDFFLRYAIEELGEIASAITRDRYQLAEEECIDLAHCALLLALNIRRYWYYAETSD